MASRRHRASIAAYSAIVASLGLCADGLFNDVLAPYLVPPPGGCKLWSETPEFDKYWMNGAPPPGAGDLCAQQGKGNPSAPWSSEGNMGDGSTGHALGSYCVAKTTGNITACTSAMGVPEQVNVQIASSDSVVVAFVTYEAEAPLKPPVVSLRPATPPSPSPSPSPPSSHSKCAVTLEELCAREQQQGADACNRCLASHWTVLGEAGCSRKSTSDFCGGAKQVEGVTHKHVTNGGRVYYMHFVRLAELEPRTRYMYSVRSGAPASNWSSDFQFRSPYSAGETRIAMYGDMGVYEWNNMGNLYHDAVETDTVDLIVHAGDHCYNEGDADERRADGYMQAFEQTLSQTLWMPVVGNHEFYSGTNLTRYLDSTWEKWGPLEGLQQGNDQASSPTELQTWGGEDGLSGHTSATSALGAFLSAGNHHGPGVHSPVPSRSSRHFSVNFGLVHLVAFSLNGYNGVDPECLPGSECDQAQIDWLRRDLAAVDRSATPWVVAITHFPLYVTENVSDLDRPVSEFPWWASEQCEYQSMPNGVAGNDCVPEALGINGTARRQLGLPHGCPPACPQHGTPGTNVYEPLFFEFGVDL